MKEIIFIVEDSPEGGCVARALDLPIFTEADDRSSLQEHVHDAVRCHFDEGEGLKVYRLHFVQDEIISA